ncbi:hypothetical protein J2Z21_000618 [Streptomyces griseochromogenes]|uniref:Uncharacterized protein n=1 Tax=Streptomyces griseochromogenes TaxID=68214 RepID=A0ABS4LJZ3_9ACTN|nr:hypothetical protein [Streptomyces griseochromogenes]
MREHQFHGHGRLANRTPQLLAEQRDVHEARAGDE